MSEDLPPNLDALKEAWIARWPDALRAWSPFVQLSEPRWCLTKEQEKQEHLTGSFAMIRLVDHAVVISLRQVAERGLERFATEILAHEIGHHVYCPADLTDNARMLARLRVGLPTKEELAPFVGNLYTDLLLNDRLQRGAGLDIAGVYRAIAAPSDDPLWLLYMRMYELLWALPKGTLALGTLDARLELDASLGARLIRSYAKDWLDGAGRFAMLCLPYLLKDDGKEAKSLHGVWRDADRAGAGGIPDGLAESEDAESAGAIHPSEDADLSGVARDVDGKDKSAEAADAAAGRTTRGGQKSIKGYRTPTEYSEILKASGVLLDDLGITARYYRELALPHLIKFPSRDTPLASDPQPEGLDLWDVGSPIEEVDWLSSVIASPVVVPGVTTVRRVYNATPGTEPERSPIDLYLGVDCSGSMGNPARALSYAVLAGAVIALSALRAGSKVMVALSGEPGKTVTTDGFLRDEKLVLRTLCGYLGTGSTFGIHRLHETFDAFTPANRPTHILVVTDNDIFPCLDSTKDAKTGWAVATESLARARGGATFVLQIPAAWRGVDRMKKIVDAGQAKMRSIGWDVAEVDTVEELVAFARRFSQANYGNRRDSARGRPATPQGI